jgi:NAD(P)H-nitrite reductase large subunit
MEGRAPHDATSRPLEPSYDYIIVGNGPAGVGGVEGIRSLDTQGSVLVLSDERDLPYTRCLLPRFISGHTALKELTYRPSRFFERNDARLELGQRAVHLDTERRLLKLGDGREVAYGKLLLATGSSPVLRGPLGFANGVVSLRTLDDARAISAAAMKGGRALVLGGGLVGIAVAIALADRGMRVLLVVSSSQVLSQNADRRAADILTSHLRAKGVEVALATDALDLHEDVGGRAAILSDGRNVPVDIVVSAKGVRPNAGLAAGASIKVGKGIIVDDQLRTSAAHVYAAGDAAEARDYISSMHGTMTLWPIASEQGRVAGRNMAGAGEPYAGGIQICSVDFLGLVVASIGEARGASGPDTAQEGACGPPYRRVFMREGRAVGALEVLEGQGTRTSVPCTRIEARSARALLLGPELDIGMMEALLLMDVRK